MKARKLQRGTYFGTVLGRDRVGPFEFTETVYRNDEQLDNHQHEDSTVFIVLSGMVRENISGGEIDHPPFTVILNPAGFEHRTCFLGTSPRVLNIQFEPGWLGSLHRSLAESRTVVTRPFAAPAIATLHASLAHPRLDHPNVELVMRNLFLPSELVRGDRPIAREAALLLVRYQHSRRRVWNVASEIGVERTRLAHAFRREYGISMKEYAGRLRFANACELLAESSASLSTVALEAGYSDQSHMSRDFRKRSGATPSRFRLLSSSEA